MKKTIIFLILLLIIPSVLAITIETNKEAYSQKETVLYKLNIDLNLTGDIQMPQIKLIDPSNAPYAVAGEIKKLSNNSYFGYFDTPNVLNLGKYKLRVKDVKYIENGELKSSDFDKEIEIKGNTQDVLSVKPGIVLLQLEKLDEPKLSFRLKNGGANIIDVSFSTEGDFLTLEQNGLRIGADDSKSITVNTNVRGNDKEQFEGSLNVIYGNNSIKIPIYLTRTSLQISNATNQSINQSLNETPQIVNLTLNTSIAFDKERNLVDQVSIEVTEKNRSINDLLYFKNTGDVKLTGIKVSLDNGLSDVVNAFIQEGTDLDPGMTGIINITVDPEKLTKDYVGNIIISTEQNVSQMMRFRVVSLIEQEITLIKKPEAGEPQEIVLQTPPQVVEDLKGESKAWIWWTLIAILVILGAFVFTFYKKGEKQKKSFKKWTSR